MIKNVVFDIGNVVTRWDPQLICSRTFGEDRATPEFSSGIFRHDIWRSLNRGELTEDEAKQAFHESHDHSHEELTAMFFHVKDTQDLVEGTVDLMERLIAAEFRLFALTDNVKEIESYLRERYDFWRHFDGVVNSAHVGCLKPGREIFNHLLDGFGLTPEHTVFMDDMPHNVDGARAMNMYAIQFKTAEQTEGELRALGLRF